MNKNFKEWFLFWLTVAVILTTLLLCMIHVVEKNTGVWDNQIQQKQTQEIDSVRINTED